MPPQKRYFRPVTHLPSDPILDQKHIAHSDDLAHDQLGSTPTKSLSRGERGTIIEIFPDTQTYTVQGERSGILRGVPRIAQSLSDKNILPIGTVVGITQDYGLPFIAGVLPFTTNMEQNNTQLNLTGDTGVGGNDALYAEKGSGNYRLPNTPRDLLPNDQVIVGQEGNAIGALAGGVSLIKSGAAQFQTHLINDMARILCRNFQHISDMGITEIKNEGGRISYTLRWGADQVTEAGSDQENWTIRLDVGATGDLFRFQLTRPDGTALFKFHVNGDGKVEMFGAQGIDFLGGAQHTQKHLADQTIVVKGSDTQTIGNDQNINIRGNQNEMISGSMTQTAGNDRTTSATRHETRSIGGNLTEKIVGGNPMVAKPTNTAYDLSINNGSWKIGIGDPAASASPAALASFLLSVFSGDIEMKIKTKGDISLDTLLGDITLDTLKGDAALKTTVGKANLDGTTVHLGPVPASTANPVLKGTIHNTAMATYLTKNTSTLKALLSATATALGGVASPPGSFLWPSAAPAMAAWITAVSTALGLLLESHASLNAALPSFLSTKSFTA